MARDEQKLIAEWFWTDRWMGSSAFLLPLEPRGLYREMLTQAWRRGARLPASHEAVQRAVGCTRAEWRRCWPQIAKYWRVDGDDLVNDTQAEVYAEAVAKHERASARGLRGAQARAQALRERSLSTTQALPECKPPSPSPSPTPRRSKPLGADAPGFAEFWNAYPKRKAKPDALKAWNKLRPDADLQGIIQAAIVRQRCSEDWRKEGGKFIPYPASWLNGRRWEDEDGISRSAPEDEEVDWFEECQRLHNRTCNGSAGHRTRMLLEAEKAASA